VSDRPDCINCGKPLGKWIGSVSVPLNRDVTEYLREQYAGHFHQMMDKYETVCARQAAQQKSYEDRVERQEQAKMRLMPGSNEPFDDSWGGQWEKRRTEDDAGDFPVSMFETRVRVWLGDYGPDRRGLFHSNECAHQWANVIAGKLRDENKI
jgi:hypothetical protein